MIEELPKDENAPVTPKDSVLSNWDSDAPTSVVVEAPILSEEAVKAVPIETLEERNLWITSWRERKPITKNETFKVDKPSIEEERQHFLYKKTGTILDYRNLKNNHIHLG